MEDNDMVVEGVELDACIGEREGKDEDICTLDGTVDRHGRPCLRGQSGGWRVASLLLVNQALTSLAYSCIGVDLVVLMTKILRQDNAEAANNVSQWTGTSQIFCLVGAFLADSYWGRYKTSVIFQFILVGGLVLLSLSSYLLLLNPCIPGDGTPHCPPPTGMEIVIFYLSIYLIALGIGGYLPSTTTFGADQFDEEDPVEAKSKVAFFSYFYLANNIGSLFSNTCLVYVEDDGKWVLAFWVSAGAAIVALGVVLVGTPWYRHFKPGGNPFSRACQVVVAACRKWNKKALVVDGQDSLYEGEKECKINGWRRILHTPDFRFLDRAAMITSENSSPQDQNQPQNPWHLCTITQVEEVKCILRLLPIWLSTIPFSMVFTQMNSIFIEQGAAMNTSISPGFHIPPASMSIFEILGVASSVFACRLFFENLTELKRMGIGLVLVSLTMISSGLLEVYRLKKAIPNTNNSSSLTILWQAIPYGLIGLSEAFMYVAQLEFFNKQAPDGLKSFGSALYVASQALGNYMSSLVVTIVLDVTKKGGRVGWIPDNLNQGRLDKFYYLLALLSGMDVVVFVACAKLYRCINLEGKVGSEVVEVVDVEKKM